METDEYEIKVFSFLEIALLIRPNGKGKIVTYITYPYEDMDTGPSTRSKEIEATPAEFLQEIYSEKEGEFEMSEETKREYRNELQKCIIQRLDRTYIEKTNSATY